MGTERGTIQRVATQLGYGVESVRQWVKRADIDEGHAPGVTTAEAKRIKEPEQENRGLRRANEILKRAASSFGAHDNGMTTVATSTAKKRGRCAYLAASAWAASTLRCTPA